MSLVGLIGLPNSGKSSIFNELTKNRQRVANFPGITVEKKLGKISGYDFDFNLIDLPGVYTLDVSTLDEKVTRDYLFKKVNDEQASVFILVIDATNLKKSIYLAAQLNEIGQKFVIALNMADLAKNRGQEIDTEVLSKKLGGAPVIPTVAVQGKGMQELLLAVKKLSAQTNETVELPKDYQKKIKAPAYIKEKLDFVDEVVKAVILKKIKKDAFTEKLDSVVLHPFWGPLILGVTLIAIFQLLFSWSDPFMGMIESFFEFLSLQVTTILPDGYLKSLIVDGVIAGVGGILVFLPHIVFLFVIIYFLEDFGYLGRAAFLLDYIMRKVGLPGKSVVPLLSSHACAIPGIMSARIIENPFQRMLTIMISPLTTCSARLPVYTLLIAAIVPDTKVLGFLGLPGLVLFALYMFGILSAFAVAYIARKTYAPTSPSYLMMELPPYRTPRIVNVLRGALQKGWIFIKKAGSIILVLSMIIWVLVSFPKAPDNAQQPQIHYSYAATIGKTFEPIFSPLGFDWKITTALIPSFAAREVLVAAMGTVFAIEAEDVEEEAFIGSLSHTLTDEYTLATLLALLVWFVFAPQCIATFGVIKKETNSYKMPLIFGAYTLALAYFFSFLTYIILS